MHIFLLLCLFFLFIYHSLYDNMSSFIHIYIYFFMVMHIYLRRGKIWSISIYSTKKNNNCEKENYIYIPNIICRAIKFSSVWITIDYYYEYILSYYLLYEIVRFCLFYSRKPRIWKRWWSTIFRIKESLEYDWIQVKFQEFAFFFFTLKFQMYF